MKLTFNLGRKKRHWLVPFFVFACSPYLFPGEDVFGVPQFYPSLEGSQEWNSIHWGNGISRTIKYSRDPYDPSDWTEDHSGQSDGFIINGEGQMTLTGNSPRFHVNSMVNSKIDAQFFLNTELTVYYRKTGLNGENWGGLVVGVRTHPTGHGSPEGDDCQAQTYYARFRHDGKWDFEKELKHPESEYWSGGGLHTQDHLWEGDKLPENKWIGMKFICYNMENDSKVKLELYIDSLSQGIMENFAGWEKVGEVIDDGNWPGASTSIEGCSYSDPNTIINQGNGTILIRTDGAQADYKMLSVREIDISKVSTSIALPMAKITQSKSKFWDLLGRNLESDLIYFPITPIIGSGRGDF